MDATTQNGVYVTYSTTAAFRDRGRVVWSLLEFRRKLGADGIATATWRRSWIQLPVEVTGFFDLSNPSSCTMALTEMSTSNALVGNRRPAGAGSW
jgi:hypothetical protein